MSLEVIFPLEIQFEDGSTEQYESREDLACNLEEFDSDLDVECSIRDKLGRPVRLKMKHLKIIELTIVCDR